MATLNPDLIGWKLLVRRPADNASATDVELAAVIRTFQPVRIEFAFAEITAVVKRALGTASVDLAPHPAQHHGVARGERPCNLALADVRFVGDEHETGRHPRATPTKTV